MLLVGLVFLFIHFSLHMLKQFKLFLQWGAKTMLKVQPHWSWVQRDIIFPGFSGHSISNTGQVALGLLGHLGTLLARTQLAVYQHPQSQFNSVQAPQRLHYSLFDVVADLCLNILSLRWINITYIILFNYRNGMRNCTCIFYVCIIYWSVFELLSVWQPGTVILNSPTPNYLICSLDYLNLLQTEDIYLWSMLGFEQNKLDADMTFFEA